MTEIFKIGNHRTAGISITFLKLINIYQIMITFTVFHLIISIPKNGLKIAFMVGNHQIYAKIDIGID